MRALGGRLELIWVENPPTVFEGEQWKEYLPFNHDILYRLYDANENISGHRGRIGVAEEVWALYLDTYGKIIGYSCIGKGDTRESVVDIQALLFTALQGRAAGVVVIHNHPHEPSPTMSDPDKAMVEAVHKALTAVRISFVDFVIIGVRSYIKDTEYLPLLNKPYLDSK